MKALNPRAVQFIASAGIVPDNLYFFMIWVPYANKVEWFIHLIFLMIISYFWNKF